MSPNNPRPLGRYDHLCDGAAILALLVMSAVALLTWRDHGITWDEGYHLDYGDHLLAFYTSGFEDKTALTFRLDYLYGGGFDLLGAIFRTLVEPTLDKYDAIHLFGMLIGILGLWGTWRLGRALGGPRAGLIAAVWIGATSVYWGHMSNNPKDLPFAVGYVWAMGYLVQTIRSFPRVPASLATKLAITMGLAMSVRIAGLLMLCYFAAAIGVWLLYQGFVRRDLEATYRYGRRLALTGIGVFAGAWLVMIVWWPWALYDPIKRPLAALRRMSQFMGHERKMPFAGELISTFDVDWRYMPHYFSFKLPEFVVVLSVLGAFVGLVLLIRRARDARAFTDNLVLGTLMLSVLFPWAYAVYKESVLYDGLRHFLFEVPILVAASAWLADGIITRVIRRFGAAGAVISAAIVTTLCVDQYAKMVQLHPHEYVYFNRFIGGVGGADGKYDTDYYAEAYTDAGAQLALHLWRQNPDEYLNTVYRVAGCGLSLRILRDAPPNFVYRRGKSGPYDFWFGYTRRNCDQHYLTSPIAVDLRRDGGRLIVVRDVRNSELEGKSARKKRKTSKKSKSNKPKARKPVNKAKDSP